MFAAYAAEAGSGVEHVAFYATADFWVLIGFLIVIGGAFRPVFRAATAALDVRADKIRTRLDQSRKLREEAQATLAEYQRKQRAAMSEAEKIVEHAKTEAERLQKEQFAALDDQMKRREKQAEDRIANAEKAAVAEVRNQAVSIAIKAVGQVLAEKLPADKQDALLEQSIKSIPSKLH